MKQLILDILVVGTSYAKTSKMQGFALLKNLILRSSGFMAGNNLWLTCL